MRRTYEVIVVGCGGIGSAAAYWLARRAGRDVLAIEQFALGHDPRQLAGPLAHHPPLVPRSELHRARRTDLRIVGGGGSRSRASNSSSRPAVWTWSCSGTTGPKDLTHCAESMREQGVPFEELSAQEIMARWPQFALPDDARGLYQADSGLVDAKKANAAHIALARLHGATIRDNLPVRELSSNGDAVEVVTDDGVFVAGHVVLACRGLDEQPARARRRALAADGDAGAGDLLRDTSHPRVLAGSVPDLDLAGAGGVLRFPGLRRGGDEGRSGRWWRGGHGGDPHFRSRCPRRGTGWIRFLETYIPRSSVPSSTPRPASTRCRPTGTS